jgi:hypothetical protein
MLNQIHSVLNATSVGNSFLLLAQINVRLVKSATMYNCHMLIPKISAGIIIAAFAIQLAASITL